MMSPVLSVAEEYGGHDGCKPRPGEAGVIGGSGGDSHCGAADRIGSQGYDSLSQSGGVGRSYK